MLPNVEKSAIRAAIWDALAKRRVAARPGTEGRVPAFRGIDVATTRLVEEQVFQRATTIYLDPTLADSGLREQVTQADKTIIFLRDQLQSYPPFGIVSSSELPLEDRLRAAPSSDAWLRLARHLFAREVPPIDLIILGSLAVDASGGRLGDGTGIGDIAYAILRQSERISVKTPILTVVHSSQVLQRPIPMERHDVPVDLVFTEETRLLTHPSHRRPFGLYDENTPRDGLP